MPFLTPAEPGAPGASSGSWPFTLRADEPCFVGHFVGAPVLPGIAHVAIALEACARLGPGPATLVAVDDLRFLQPLGPGDACAIAVVPDTPRSWRFEIRRAGALASSGRLVFAGDGAA